VNWLGFDLREEYSGRLCVGVRVRLGRLWLRRGGIGQLSVHEPGKLFKSGEGFAYG